MHYNVHYEYLYNALYIIHKVKCYSQHLVFFEKWSEVQTNAVEADI